MLVICLTCVGHIRAGDKNGRLISGCKACYVMIWTVISRKYLVGRYFINEVTLIEKENDDGCQRVNFRVVFHLSVISGLWGQGLRKRRGRERENRQAHTLKGSAGNVHRGCSQDVCS